MRKPKRLRRKNSRPPRLPLSRHLRSLSSPQLQVLQRRLMQLPLQLQQLRLHSAVSNQALVPARPLGASLSPLATAQLPLHPLVSPSPRMRRSRRPRRSPRRRWKSLLKKRRPRTRKKPRLRKRRRSRPNLLSALPPSLPSPQLRLRLPRRRKRPPR